MAAAKRSKKGESELQQEGDQVELVSGVEMTT